MQLELVQKVVDAEQSAVRQYMRRLVALERPFVLSSDLNAELDALLEEGAGAELVGTEFERLVRSTQEAAVASPWVYLSVRIGVGRWSYCRIQLEDLRVDSVDVSDFLAFREQVLYPELGEAPWTLELDLGPFVRGFPRLRNTSSIGRGVEFLNRHLAGKLFNREQMGERLMLDFLRVHNVRGRQLMLNGRIDTAEQLREATNEARRALVELDPETPSSEFEMRLRGLGLEPGWGGTARKAVEMFELLADIFEAPTPENLQGFLSRVPMIFSIAILSPHGYFGQANVLGLPDTGGQVVYILDQVRALEEEMRRRNWEAGLVDVEPQIVVITRLLPECGDTTCGQRLEPIHGTEAARILRVPFREASGEVVPHWISRFDVWPYLERFSVDVERELGAELGGRPDLVIGNYSDGNLVASLLAQRLGVTQCNIAHALEKTKYLFSALYWQDLEPQYHFSCQFSADLISMNYADFIITSTFQEIAGNDDAVGQYESYQSFTMPGLLRVVNGVDVFDPKFNIVSPGADPRLHFPYSDEGRRFVDVHEELESALFEEGRPGTRGQLADPDRPPIFLMSRLDRIKNATGFTEWFARCDVLRDQANLVLVAGTVDPAASSDDEEIAQVHRMHELFDEYGLDDQVRWMGRMDKYFGAELYRLIADRRGVFVQPALFEAFGLTVIEAMVSGLPTFATRFGGPLEIIVDGVSGFHIDPNNGAAAAERIADFFSECRDDPERWQQISRQSVARVEDRYTWRLYASRLMDLSRIYGFWKYMTNLERQETRRYLEMFYGLMHPRLSGEEGWSE